MRLLSQKTSWLIDIGLLLGIIIVATMLNPNWAFSPLEVLPIAGIYNDQWSYIGPMLDLSDKLNFVAQTYATHPIIQEHGYILERFSWSVPGSFFYETFSPLIANYLLKLWVYGLSVIGIYWALRNLFGRKTGLLTGLCLGGYAWFLRSAGWDYIDGVGMGYFSMTFAFIIAAISAQKKLTWRIACVGVGIFAVNLVVTNLYLALFTPHFLIVALWLNHRKQQHPIIQSLIWGILGVGVMVFIYGLISYTLRGDWFFLRTTLSASGKLMTTERLKWVEYNTFIYLKMNPYYQVLPVLLLIVGILGLRKRLITAPIQRLVLFQFLWLYGVLAITSVLMQPYLIMVLYSSYIMPATFLWLGGLISPHVEALPDTKFTKYILIMIGLVLTPFILSILLPFTFDWQNNFWIALMSVIGFVVSSRIFTRQIRVVILLGGIVMLGWLTSKQIDVFHPDRLKGQETFMIAFDGYNAVQNHYTQNGIRDVQFIQDVWIHTKMPMVVPSMLYFDAYHLRPAIYLDEASDSLNISNRSQVDSIFNRVSIGQTSQKTVLITRFPETFERFTNQYLVNYEYVLEDSITIERHGMTMYVYFLAIMP